MCRTCPSNTFLIYKVLDYLTENGPEVKSMIFISKNYFLLFDNFQSLILCYSAPTFVSTWTFIMNVSSIRVFRACFEMIKKMIRGHLIYVNIREYPQLGPPLRLFRCAKAAAKNNVANNFISLFL